MKAALSIVDFAALGPLLILLTAALLMLLLESFAEKAAKKLAFPLVLAGIAAALIASFYAPASSNPLLTPWLRFDSLAYYFTILFLAIGLASALLAEAFFRRFEAQRGEYVFLLLSSLFGLILIGAAADFLILFLGLETLSISLYVLCGYMKKWGISHEASIKYLLIGSLGAAFLIYGIALVYGATGITRFDGLLEAYNRLSASPEKALFLSGIAFVTVGLAFKAAVVPFHVWAPDVYEGAPTPVTAFMAVGTKAGAFAAFAILFLVALPKFNPLWNKGLELLIYPTLIYANIVALRQLQLRRFFAYSGISHAGFLLIPIVTGTADALPALKFYLVIYALATLGAFAIFAIMDHRKEGVALNDLKGFFHRSPLLASILALCLLTLAGVPPTAGFFAKFFVFKVAFQAGYYGLVIAGLLTAVLSAYYYIRIISVMFSETPTEANGPGHSWPAATVGLISLTAIVILSCYPAPLMLLLF